MQPRRFLTGTAVVLFLMGPFAAALHAQQDGVIEDLGTLGIDSFAYAVNASGQAVGDSTTASGIRAFVTTGGGLQELPTLGGAQTSALGINDAGIVVGYSNDATGNPRAFRYDPAATPPLLDLGTLGGDYAYATWINTAGAIVGYSETATGDDEAFMWTPAGGMQPLGSLGFGFSYAYGINDVNQIVGTAWADTGFQAFVYELGAMQSLGTLGGADSEAYAINNAGQVTGMSFLPGNGETRAFRYTPGNGMDPLPSLGGLSSRGEAIAPDGTIVGSCVTATGLTRACLWTPANEVVDLNTRIDPALGWVLTNAMGINGNGQIVGFGNVNDVVRAFRLTLPVQDPQPPAAPAIHSITATPSSLWPANNKLVTVTVTVDATDAAGTPAPCAITGVTSNEPADDDIVMIGALEVQLRAERLGSGNGRTYRIDVACGSSADAMATGHVDVVVPKNQSGDDNTRRRR